MEKHSTVIAKDSVMSTMGKLWIISVLSFMIIIDGEALPKQVCVIGAGRAGLAVIKSVADRMPKFKPIAFERNSDVGGLWIYRDKIDNDEHGLPVQTSVYKNLRTLTPKDTMTYPDYKTLVTGYDPYIPHETFLSYMRNYTDHFGLRKYIQLDTIVTKVKPVTDRCKPGTTRWMIENQNLNSNKVDTTVCDAVVVCNGRFSKPNVPILPGIGKFPGRILHSQAYREPESFTNKRVVVWGAGASALGITRDLSAYAKSIFLSHKKSFSLWEPNKSPDNVFVVKNVVAVDGSDFIIEDNSRITADAFIYCTGYVYNFPFLDESSGIAPDRNRLFPLQKNFINKEHPSMAFIGLGNDNARPNLYYLEVNKIYKFGNPSVAECINVSIHQINMLLRTQFPRIFEDSAMKGRLSYTEILVDCKTYVHLV